MHMNDSESSDEDTEGYTTTKALLGFASKEPTDDSFSQLGGRPTWLDPQSRPDAELVRCRVCQNMMTMLLQLNGDLPDRFPNHERRLYIFACKGKPCRRKEGSIRAIRAIRVSNTTAGKLKKKNSSVPEGQNPRPKTPPRNLGNILFNLTSAPRNSGSANPFATPPPQSSNPFSTSNPFTSPSSALVSKPSQSPTLTSLPETFAQKVRPPPPAPPLSTPQTPWPPDSGFPPPYPRHHLDADFETLDAPSLMPSSLGSTHFNDDDPSITSPDPADKDPETFESPLDKTFHRFADRLAQNPLQVLRYEFSGSPLLFSKSDAVGKIFGGSLAATNNSHKKITTTTTTTTSPGIPRCTNCSAPRVFELQLTPQAIAELEVDETGLEGMEWGSVVLGVCSRDCEGRDMAVGGVAYVEEWVGVQWEEVGGGGGGGR